ncbi:cytochrome c [Wenzhouxiangella sp. XN79A]|uniref:c-type cytochrome n=1 Tax=Wenzhouxiangella sp. XN79A TaxID=2724193 RepID=UPI00144A64D2|nr:cytochrome c [Wenzhouxiangella sp. XN79A]NKI35605.1 cytochrome c [Wenzhouxiangella sp. XN79A]
MIRSRSFLSGTVLAAVLAATIPGSARAELPQDQAERAVETRQSVLHLMAWNMAPLGAMARDRIEFDGERVTTNADRLLALSKMLSDAFGPDTRGNDVETEALDVIWENPEDFAAKVQANIDAATALVEISASGDEGAIKEAIGRLGSTCGSCHDDFRVDD